jgi:hypothetical protein
MAYASSSAQEDRPVTAKEARLIQWLIEHGNSKDAAVFLSQLKNARVVARCGCGCASFEFAVGGRRNTPASGMQILSDFKWSDEHGHLFGVYVFARGGLLAGLDLWSIDGEATASSLPNIEQLVPLHQTQLH